MTSHARESSIIRAKFQQLAIVLFAALIFSGPELLRAVEKPWAAKLAEVERAWLGLLGDFPEEAPPLKPEMKEVSRENGITRYHASFRRSRATG